VSGFIALSDYGVHMALEEYPALRRRPYLVVPHGHYIGAYENKVSRSAAREALDLDANDRVALFVGRIARYKNVRALIRCFVELRDAGVKLIIAGNPANALLAKEIEAAAAGDDRVHLRLKYVRDEELQVLLNASDVVVLPFSTVLNSGTALLGLSFGRPVLVPRAGAMPELQREFGEFWVRTYDNPLRKTDLQRALDDTGIAPSALRQLDHALRLNRDWRVAAQSTGRFYRELLAEPREPYLNDG